MATPLNIGMIGYGFMGRAHSNAYKQVGQFFPSKYKVVLKAVAARDAAKAKPFAEQSAAPSAQDVEQLHTDGIVGRKGAFSAEWTDRLGEDIMALFRESLDQPGAAVGRGPNRYYVEIHPERLRGFVDLVTHPWVTGMCEAVLGHDYQIVEIGFDVPLPGAVNQPWHRDFPAPPETTRDRRLTSLAFNLTTVDVTPEMGPFEIAPGTQWDDSPEFEHGMFPPKSHWPRYEALGRRLPAHTPVNVFRAEDHLWTLSYRGRTVRLREAKGLRDLATLLATPDTPVPAVRLYGGIAAVADNPAERARTTVTARINDVLRKIAAAHPQRWACAPRGARSCGRARPAGAR